MSFSGEPHIFPLFMRNFEVNVESKEENDADRLSYFVQYCRGKARKAIALHYDAPRRRLQTFEGDVTEELWPNPCSG